MEKIAYKLKDYFAHIKSIISSPKFIKKYDKVVKVIKNIVPKIIIISILIIFSYIFMSPILRVFIDSFKVKEDITNPDIVWIPTQLTFQNYLDAAKGLWLWRTDKSFEGAIISTFWNSTIYSLLSAIFQTVVACMAGYAFARFNFKGKGLWFAGLILAFIIPIQLLTLPRSMMLSKLKYSAALPSDFLNIAEGTLANFIDSFFSVISAISPLILTIFGQGINSSILIFIAFSFFKMIPVALDEAAQIDGANFFQIFTKVILKMSVPTIAVIFLFAFIWNWNDVYVIGHLVYSGNQLTFQTLPQALSDFTHKISQGGQVSGIQNENSEDLAGLRSASILISILPLLILYAFTQRKFVEGIENTGVTGV
ncbi:MAG: carbohydrate ABC transporter permease [Erysipelotrichaceae bacterium]|nr:carbohydrate ABC transporter permease [Erysipelotrichaceae bacterium]